MKQRSVLLCHVGFHRCASTSIQAFLEAHRDALSDKGWTLLLRQQLKDQPALLAFRRGHWRDAWLPTGLMRLVTLILALRRYSGSILLSEENLLGHMPGLKDNRPYPRLAWALTFLRLFAFLTGRQLLIVAVDRPEQDWRHSLWRFRKTKGETRYQEEFEKSLSGGMTPAVQTLNTLGDRFTLLSLSDVTPDRLRDCFRLPAVEGAVLSHKNKS